MKITHQELIEFADQQGLKIFGNGKFITSKIRALNRLISRELIPKPIWKGGTSIAYWENDTEIKDRILWLDEQREKGKSYKKIQVLLNNPSLSSDAMVDLEPILSYVNSLIEIHPSVLDNYFVKAGLYKKIGHFEKALDIYKDILPKVESDDYFISMLYAAMINSYHLLNNKEEEEIYCKKYVAFAQERNDDEFLACAYSLIGSYYTDIDPEVAIKYFRKAEELEIDQIDLGHLYFWASDAEFNAKNYQNAKQYLKKALEIFPSNSIDQANTKGSLGKILLLNDKNYDEALKYFIEAKEILHFQKNVSDEAIVTSYIGMVYKEKGEYKRALQMFRFAINNLDPHNHPIEYKMQLQQMMEVYYVIGDEKKYEFYKEEEQKIQVTCVKTVKQLRR